MAGASPGNQACLGLRGPNAPNSATGEAERKVSIRMLGEPPSTTERSEIGHQTFYRTSMTNRVREIGYQTFPGTSITNSLQRLVRPDGLSSRTRTSRRSASRRQGVSLRNNPPNAQRLDRQDNRKRTGHAEDIERPDEQQGAALLEKLGAQSILHVQRQDAGGRHAAK